MGTTAATLVSISRTVITLAVVAWVGLQGGHAQAQESVAVYSPESDSSLRGRVATARLASVPPRVTLERTRLSSDDASLRSPGALDAYGRPLVELGGVTFRWWVTRGASNFGVGVGALGALSPVSDSAFGGQTGGQIGGQNLSQVSSVLTLGWRYNVSEESTVFADASGVRRLNNEGVDRYSTKVGLEWKGRTSKFGVDAGSRSLGLQLDSGYKMSVKVRRNGVGIFVKGQF